MSDEIGPLVRYGDEDGPVFLRRCPKCARMVKAPERVVLKGGDGQPLPAQTTCSKCGPIELDLICWGGDL